MKGDNMITVKNKTLEETIYINDVEYRLVCVRNRWKYVSRNGDLINPFRPNQYCKVSENQDGYLVSGGSVPVHLYVARAYLDGYNEGLEVDHIDYNRHNNNVSNLRYVTHENNVKHSSKVGHYKHYYNDNPNFRYQEIYDKVDELKASGMSRRKIMGELKGDLKHGTTEYKLLSKIIGRAYNR